MRTEPVPCSEDIRPISGLMCNSLNSSLRTVLAKFYVSDTDGYLIRDLSVMGDITTVEIGGPFIHFTATFNRGRRALFELTCVRQFFEQKSLGDPR
jgi:hypothetical protein